MSEDRKDKGWEYLQNDGAEGSFYEDDGSWGSQNSDGSGSYYGADGSWCCLLYTSPSPRDCS